MPAAQVTARQGYELPSNSMRAVPGAVAGNVAVTGIKKGDTIIEVLNLTDGADLTAQFKLTPTVAADGFINNTGGTSTATKILLVRWLVRPKGA